MVQERSVTPEKQLLKLIEAKPGDLPAASKARAIKRKGLSFFSPGAWLGRVSFFKARYKQKIKVSQLFRFDIKIFNRALLGVASMLLVYFVIDVSASVISLRDMPILDYQPQETPKAILQESTDLLKFEASYLSKIRQRDIFKMGIAPVGKKDIGADLKPATSAIVDATAHLRLVGISWSESPDVLIEDTRALRTFFVKRGQSIDHVKIEAIFRDKVVLSYEGEEVELK